MDDWIVKKVDDNEKKQAEAGVVPSSSLVELELEAGGWGWG